MSRISIAPMMDHTDRHFRAFMRAMSRKVVLYTEMVTTGAVIHGDRARLLGFAGSEHPVVLQLGGDDPAALALCARIGEDLGYDEINLNVGCPSPRVSAGGFGASLMTVPHVVAEGVSAMREAVRVPVTVKHRIGVDELDGYEHMLHFVDTVAAAGCERFIVHARKAWLSGLSPRENREIPPLRYDLVVRLAQERPHLSIEINGGITQTEAVRHHLAALDGVMIGRAVLENPFWVAELAHDVLGEEDAPATPEAVVEACQAYLSELVASGEPAPRLTRHMTALFLGRPGARRWRRTLSEQARHLGADALKVALASRAQEREVAA